MPARSLLLATFLLVTAAPAGAQEYVWTGDRPDGVAPLGVFADRTLGAGSLEVSLVYRKTDQEGIRLDSELIDPTTLFDFFTVVPFELTSQGWYARGAYGVSDDLTVTGRVGFLERDRVQFTEDFTFFDLEASGITDVEVQALYSIWDQGPYRAQLQAGVLIPTGSVEEEGAFAGVRSGTLPYDTQIGAGGWGIMPGFTAQVMNEHGSVGGQVVATLFVADKGDWRPGDQVEANAWGAFRFNRFFSSSVRVHAIAFGAIEGFDPDLDPDRDPGELPTSFSGRRVDIPVGVNFYMPEGRWQGHRLGLELVFPVHEKFDGPWLSNDWELVVGWQKAF